MRSRAARLFLLLVVVLGAWALVRRYALRPAIPPPDAATLEHVRRVRIVRDTWGVPHVFGERDQDAAFGLAYAHAEDDYPTIQTYRHPREVDTRLLPFTGRDVAAGFAHKLPIMLGLDKVLGVLRSDAPPHVGEPVFPKPPAPTSGSNAHALSAARSTDGITRLNVNSHQPWEGPVAWYEAHVHSDEGWDMTGGTFPGAPFILHGHNASLGWALTVNAPDLIDVYELVRDAAHPGQYRLDGAWRDLEVHEAPLVIDTGLFDLSISRTFQASVQGPVVSGEHGAFAVRYAGIGRRLRAVEPWFRMNKATSLDTFRAAMRVASAWTGDSWAHRATLW